VDGWRDDGWMDGWVDKQTNIQMEACQKDMKVKLKELPISKAELI
jgi:hypothetical protein